MDFMALNSPQRFAFHHPRNFHTPRIRNYPPPPSLPCLLPSLRRRQSCLEIVAAASPSGKHDNSSSNNNSRKKKEDSHSFLPRPDEATGPFPEAVLLKERKVEEDGMLMPEFADVEERELFEALNLQLESDMDVEQMRHYEVVYLIHEDHEDEVENINAKVQEFLKEKKGKIWRLSDWGMRRLAYKIRKANKAHYILMNFELEAKWINDFKSLLDRDERVIRHLVMKRDKAETEDCPPPPEFHTLRAADADADEEDEEEYEDEEDDEDWGDDEEGVIYVDDEDDGGASEKSFKSNKAKPVGVVG